MNRDPAEVKHRQEVWWILQELKVAFLRNNGQPFQFYLENKPGKPEFMQQRALIEGLLTQGVLESANFLSFGREHMYMVELDETKFADKYEEFLAENNILDVELIKQDTGLFLAYESQLQEFTRVRAGQTPDQLLEAFFELGPSNSLRLRDLQKRQSELRNDLDIGDTLRKLGFDKLAKYYFFPSCGKRSSGFRPRVAMSRLDLMTIASK